MLIKVELMVILVQVYQMQRDDVSNHGTISIAEMMCTKSKSWEGNTLSRKGMDLYQFQLIYI